MSRFEANKKLIGKRVKIVDREGEWFGKIQSVKDAETFVVQPDVTRNLIEVDIFDIKETYEVSQSFSGRQ